MTKTEILQLQNEHRERNYEDEYYNTKTTEESIKKGDNESMSIDKIEGCYVVREPGKNICISTKWDDMKDGDVKFEMEKRGDNYIAVFLTKNRKYTIRIEKSDTDKDLNRIVVDEAKRLRHATCHFIDEVYTAATFEKIFELLRSVSYDENNRKMEIVAGNDSNTLRTYISFYISNGKLLYEENTCRVFL